MSGNARWNGARLGLWGLWGLWALAAPLPASAAPRAYVPTHGMMLDSLASRVAGELLLGRPSDRTVTILLPMPGDSSGVLAQRLLERLRTVSGDVRVRELPPAPAPGVQPPTMPPGMRPATDGAAAEGPSTLELHGRMDEAGVAYTRRIRSFPFGVKGYERLVTMRASVTMLDSRTGQVAWAKTASASATDVVPKRDLGYVSGGWKGWDPPLPRGSGSRFLEPLIVVGVVAGLVVLFYSNRN